MPAKKKKNNNNNNGYLLKAGEEARNRWTTSWSGGGTTWLTDSDVTYSVTDSGAKLGKYVGIDFKPRVTFMQSQAPNSPKRKAKAPKRSR